MGEAVDAQIEDSDPVGRVRDAMRQRRNGLEFPDPILFLYNFVPTSKEMCRHRQRGHLEFVLGFLAWNSSCAWSVDSVL